MIEPVLAPVVFFDLGDTLTFLDANNQHQRYVDALDTLQILRERGYRLGLLSNQSPGTTVDRVHALLDTLALSAYVESNLITISSEIPGNVGKPDKPIFDLGLQKAGHPAASQQSIFVTETTSHIEAARSYGWRAILKRNTSVCQPVDGECVSNLSGLLSLLPAIPGLAGTNLQLAPLAKLVDGLWAAPIDIQRITAALSFDGATSSGTGDATLEFKMGNQIGNPIFDLRQSITATWLDGASLPVTKLAHHDFGGGAHAELRIIEVTLAAGSTHTLRVTYALGKPQASSAGSYQPSMTWIAGPRLSFNFGFTDLGAGRYLEAWVPANLIFDQFELLIDLHILNTTVAHTVVTNGRVTTRGANHWRVNFPERFTALSPLLELRASDTLVGASDTTTLPVSGANVAIEAWKLNSSSINLADQINNIKTYLAADEISSGKYMHGNRFVSFLHAGGMEYEGGTTTGTGALRHETFHSWWARGVKPASQPDAWFDEAWTVYNDQGASESQPFNFTDPAIVLCPRNPWVRVTVGNAYSDGYRFWKGIAALIGVNTLKGLMKAFYAERRDRPVTTTDIEEFLICHTGNVQLVDAFHRFVFGFDNPLSKPDLWLRDDPAHTGVDPWSGRFWNSPDLWVRNNEDAGLTHQNPEFGQDNWFHARVRNRGTATVRHFVVTFNVKEYAGTEFLYPIDFLPCVAAASGFDLAPGASTIIKARWPRAFVPSAGTHPCLTATVLTQGDQPIIGRLVWEHNNLAQKNLTIVDLRPNEWFVLPFVISNLRSRLKRTFVLELVRPEKYIDLEASLLQRSAQVFRPASSVALQPFEHLQPQPILDVARLIDCAGHAILDESGQLDYQSHSVTSSKPGMLASLFPQGTEAKFPKGQVVQVPVLVRQHEQIMLGLRLKVPPVAMHETLHLDLVQRVANGRQILGGIAVEIRVL